MQSLRQLDGRGLAQVVRELGRSGMAQRGAQLFDLVRRWAAVGIEGWLGVAAELEGWQESERLAATAMICVTNVGPSSIAAWGPLLILAAPLCSLGSLAEPGCPAPQPWAAQAASPPPTHSAAAWARRTSWHTCWMSMPIPAWWQTAGSGSR